MTDKELDEFIEFGEKGFVAFAMMFGDGWAQRAIDIAKELRAAVALRAALAQGETTGRWVGDKEYWEYQNQPEQEPVAWGFQNTGITGSNRWMYLKETIPAEDQYRGVLWTPLYATPPQREWQGLTDEEVESAFMANTCCDDLVVYEHIARAIEAKLKEKNNR